MSRYGVAGGAVVSSSFQGTDQSYLCAALAELGAGWVGVVQLDLDTSDETILSLHEAGVRGIRFNLKRAAVDIESITQQALRAHELVGWHVELYADGNMLASLEPVILKLPALSIDHLGMSMDGLPYLLNLVERGAYVKASGFGRADVNVADVLARVHSVNPGALMFGSDLPGVRAHRPFELADLRTLADAVGGDLTAVLEDNARRFYRLPARETAAADGSDRTIPLPSGERIIQELLQDTAPLPAIDD